MNCIKCNKKLTNDMRIYKSRLHIIIPKLEKNLCLKCYIKEIILLKITKLQ
jgi:hypothetical protein